MPIVIIVMVLSGIVISKTRVEDGRIIVEGNDVLSIFEVEDRVSLKVNDMIVVEAKDQDRITQIKDILQNNSKFTVLCYVEIGFAFLVASLILISMMLKALENLFSNV